MNAISSVLIIFQLLRYDIPPTDLQLYSEILNFIKTTDKYIEFKNGEKAKGLTISGYIESFDSYSTFFVKELNIDIANYYIGKDTRDYYGYERKLKKLSEDPYDDRNLVLYFTNIQDNKVIVDIISGTIDPSRPVGSNFIFGRSLMFLIFLKDGKVEKYHTKLLHNN